MGLWEFCLGLRTPDGRFGHCSREEVTSIPLVVPMYVTACSVICFKPNSKVLTRKGALSWLNAKVFVRGPTPLSGGLVRCFAHLDDISQQLLLTSLVLNMEGPTFNC